MGSVGISRHDLAAAYNMASGWCPVCQGEHGSSCNVCGGSGRLLPYRVKEGVRCATCNEFTREPDGSRHCSLTDSPLWSPWTYHACPLYACNDEEWR